jgi:hypothetical protein
MRERLKDVVEMVRSRLNHWVECLAMPVIDCQPFH